MGDYRSLRVWMISHQLVLEVYHATRSFPPAERYGLTSQLRRAASSIPANLAEGCGRDSDKELVRFARISLGSASELEYHLLLARDLGLLEPATHHQLDRKVTQLKPMLAKLTSYLSTED